MSMHRDFDAMLAEQAGEKPTFVIGGQTFTLRAKLPFAKWNKLVNFMRADEVDPMEQTRKFFDTCLIRADRARFIELLEVGADDEDDDDTPSIGIEQMGPLTDWAMEHFTGKLQSSSNGSSPGSSETGQSRNVVSLNSRATGG